MTNKIKQRIEQINRGEVPQGYKKTAVGIVPQEWEETQLSKIFTFKNGLNKEKEAFGKGTPIVNYVDVWKKRGVKANDVQGKVALSEKEIENYNVKKGDVFFTRTSETKDEIGLSSVMLEDIENAVFSGFVLRARPFNKKIFTPYNQYCYSSNLMRYEVIRKSSITTRALTSGPSLGQVQINLPTITEQKHIADILSKWDEAITLQEKLIKKLELQKKALMQKLLTPKDGWKKVKLFECCDINKGDQINGSDLIDEAPYKMINGGITESGYTDKYNRNANTVTISEGGNSCGYVNFIKETFWCGGHCYSLDNANINKLYLFYYLKNIETDIMRLRVGSGLPNIQKETLSNIKLHYPKKELVDLYANAFFSFDNNIILQIQKLEKLKQQQKAMQQLLLTGIVRV